MTFDVSEVMPSYHYSSCKCLIPYNNKMLMLLSLDGTTDCNMFFSINDDGSELAVLDVSNDLLKFTGAKTVKIARFNVSGLSDYHYILF